nr:MAG TPA: hypothetical protein [Caudoviricetes sp.]
MQYYEKVVNLASLRVFFDFCQFLKHSFRKRRSQLLLLTLQHKQTQYKQKI